MTSSALLSTLIAPSGETSDPHVIHGSGSTTPDPEQEPTLSVGLIVLIVLASLCAILGAIYAYIYFTRINPKSHRARNQGAEDDGNGSTHTHMFLFRKS